MEKGVYPGNSVNSIPFLSYSPPCMYFCVALPTFRISRNILHMAVLCKMHLKLTMDCKGLNVEDHSYGMFANRIIENFHVM